MLNGMVDHKTKSNRHRFTTQEVEPKTELNYMGARFYDPDLGRFLQVDPAREFWNSYCYVGNNPVYYSDQNGKEAVAFLFGFEHLANKGTKFGINLGGARVFAIGTKFYTPPQLRLQSPNLRLWAYLKTDSLVYRELVAGQFGFGFSKTNNPTSFYMGLSYTGGSIDNFSGLGYQVDTGLAVKYLFGNLAKHPALKLILDHGGMTVGITHSGLSQITSYLGSGNATVAGALLLLDSSLMYNISIGEGWGDKLSLDAAYAELTHDEKFKFESLEDVQSFIQGIYERQVKNGGLGDLE